MRLAHVCLLLGWLALFALATPVLAQKTTGDLIGSVTDTTGGVLPGVTPGVQRDPGGGFLAVSISGARHTSNNYMIDGISNNDRYYGDSVLNQTGVVGVPATLVPMDAIAEFTVQQTPSAEFGVKGGGAINVVMKSGTNQVHGTTYYFRHDDWTDSPNHFVKKEGGTTTPVKNQQFGGTFGGPI